jgi:hypothetical protein
VVAGDIAGAAITDPARLVAEGVPDGPTAAVNLGCSLDLVRGGGGRPEEVGRETGQPIAGGSHDSSLFARALIAVFAPLLGASRLRCSLMITSLLALIARG